MNDRHVPVLRCFAGDLPLGLAADDVLGFHPAEPGQPHIATLLGVPAATTPSGQLTLSLADGDQRVLISVDGPVKIRPFGPADILPVPAFFAPASILPLLGFAQEDGRVVLLVDIPSVSRIARGALQGKPSC